MDLLLVGVGSLAASIAAVWLVLSSRGGARTLAALALLAALVLFLTVSLSRDTEHVAIVALALGAVAVAAGRYALDLHAPSGTAPVSDAAVAAQPRKPVLLMNLRSGGGKAERVDLAGRCKEPGIEPIVLHP